MSVCGNCLLCNENFVTYGTVFTLGKTGLGTSRSYCLVDYIGVTGCGDNSLIKNFTTIVTYVSGGKTGVGTGCGSTLYGSGVRMLAGKICITSITNFVVVLICVTECVNYSLSNEKLATYGTGLTLGETRFGTCRRYCINDNLGMAGCGNSYIVSGKLNGTYGAINYAVIVTCVLTSRSNALFYNCLACGVTERVNDFLCNESFITYGTMLTFSKTGCSTSRSYCLIDNLGVAESIGMIVNLDFATYGTCVGGITAVYTIGSGYFGAVGVTKSRYLIISVSIVTCGASISGVACSGTCGSSYYCTVVVTKSGLLIVGGVVTS